MRDLRHLEQLSSTAALGLWADDVVLALDRARSGTVLSDAESGLLRDAAETLEATLERTEHPLTTPKTARGLAATETALTVVATLVQGQPEKSERELLAAMASVLRQAADGALTTDDAERVSPVMDLFGMVGEHQLVASNSVLTSRREARAWTAAPAISSSS
ncbi:MAG: hypothetical protein LC808_24810 [Actinobacteria bacterium]|nr:hypothetical protein [Actinomycetota bacterium]